MIEINLLPGTGKKTKRGGGGASMDLGAAFRGFAAKVTDPFLISALAAGVLAALVIGVGYTTQTARQSSLEAKERRALQDSTSYAIVVKSIRRAQAQRDSVLRQMNIIKVIDNNRFVWPHVMDEVSKALPPYTWLTSISQTNVEAPPVGTPAASAEPKLKPGQSADSAAAARPVQMQIVGNTVDIQALTRFMKALEGSAFIQNITLVKTTVIPVDGKEVTEFQLTGTYQQPDTSLVRRVPISLSVR